MSAMSDEEIQRLVLEELRWDPEVEPTDVGVEVDKGVVTLTGTVESYTMKMAAERAAKRVEGVKAVANDIKVKLPFESTRTDTDIATAAINTLSWDTRIPADKIKVTVRDGWLTLEGEVNWHYQKTAAEDDVRGLWGVKGVSNLIKVREAVTKPSPAEIRARIEEAFERSAQLDAKRINVDVRDGKVILSGTVRAWAERKEAEDAAWSAPGVTDVEDRIEVAPQ